MSRRSDLTTSSDSDSSNSPSGGPLEETDLAVDAPLSRVVHPLREKEDAVSAGTMRAGEAGSVDSSDRRTWDIEVGVDVICTGGSKLGEVVAVKDDYIVVEKGFFMPEDVFVPKSAIDHYDEHELTLNVSKDKALHSGWDEEPEHPAHRPAM